MKLYTIQHRKAFNKLMETGVLHADESHLFCGDEFRFAYDWISSQLTKRVIPPPPNVHYPIWLWYQWEGSRRPDIRTFKRISAEKGTPVTLLTVEIPDRLVMLSDFDMWHIVLTDDYLPIDESDEENHTVTKEQSWERIFDFSIENNYWGSPADRTIQANVWEIRKEQILSAKHYIAG